MKKGVSITIDGKLHLTTAQAAERAGKSEYTMRKWRHLKKGPPFIKIGNKAYYPASGIKKK